MATPLDVGLVKNFSIIFPFLLVLVVIYGVASFTKLFGDNKTMHALIALVLAISLMFSDTAREVINVMAPWFVLLFIFTVFMILAFKVFGTSNDDIMGVLKNKEFNYIIWWVVSIALVIGLGSLSYVTFGEGQTPEAAGLVGNVTYDGEVSGKGTNTFFKVITHPKILGMALILLIGAFTIQKLAGASPTGGGNSKH